MKPRSFAATTVMIAAFLTGTIAAGSPANASPAGGRHVPTQIIPSAGSRPFGYADTMATSCTSSKDTYFSAIGDSIRRPAYSGRLNCVLGIGNQGTAVRVLQRNLNRSYGRGLVEDGIYGQLTANAVAYAQSRAGITVDGVYGPQTCNRIRWYFLNSPNIFVANTNDCG